MQNGIRRRIEIDRVITGADVFVLCKYDGIRRGRPERVWFVLFVERVGDGVK